MGLVLMSGRQLHRAGVLAEIVDGSPSVASGAALLGLTARRMLRLIERYRIRGASALHMAIATGPRTDVGRPSNTRRCCGWSRRTTRDTALPWH